MCTGGRLLCAEERVSSFFIEEAGSFSVQKRESVCHSYIEKRQTSPVYKEEGVSLLLHKGGRLLLSSLYSKEIVFLPYVEEGLLLL